MAEPTTSAASIAASISGVTMSLLGVPWLAVVWGFVGAMATLSQMQQMPLRRAILFGVLSTLVGAAMGTFGTQLLNLTGNMALVLGSVVGGAGAHAIIGALVQRAVRAAEGNKPAADEPVFRRGSDQ